MLRRAARITASYPSIRKIAFLWFGPGGSLVVLDAFAPQLQRRIAGWQGVLLLTLFLLVHNATWLLVFFPRVRQRVAISKTTQWIVLSISFGVWVVLAISVQKYFALKELSR